MINKSMERKIQAAECMDVSKFKRNRDGDYILPEFIDDLDYADADREFWINSIGQNNITGEILASTSNKFYQNPDFTCLFLR